MNYCGVAILGSLLCIMGVQGCSIDMWENYAHQQYDRDRANRICHPYTHCEQGTWVSTVPTGTHVDAAYVTCKELSSRASDEWSQDLVSLGLETNRCMTKKGYRLVRE